MTAQKLPALSGSADAGRTETRLAAQSGDGYTFHITPCGSGCRLTVEPEYRHNGTQSLDGWFPRHYSRAQYAKAALTRFLGEAVAWEDVTDGQRHEP